MPIPGKTEKIEGKFLKIAETEREEARVIVSVTILLFQAV